MYKKIKPTKTTLTVNTAYEGETIEKKINRIVNNKEPIKDGAPLIYQERKDGVQPEYDIRTDRFEHAVTAMDAVAKTYIAQRTSRQNPKPETPKTDGGAEPLQATEPK